MLFNVLSIDGHYFFPPSCHCGTTRFLRPSMNRKLHKKWISASSIETSCDKREEARAMPDSIQSGREETFTLNISEYILELEFKISNKDFLWNSVFCFDLGHRFLVMLFCLHVIRHIHVSIWCQYRMNNISMWIISCDVANGKSRRKNTFDRCWELSIVISIVKIVDKRNE